MFNLSWVKIKEPRAVALLHGGSQEIPHFELQEFYRKSKIILENSYVPDLSWIPVRIRTEPSRVLCSISCLKPLDEKIIGVLKRIIVPSID